MRTSLYTVLCIAIRLGAVLLAVGLLERALDIYVIYAPGPVAHRAMGVLLLQIFGLAVAAALWLRPGLLAWWAIGRNGHEVLESSIDADRMQQIAFSVTGAWLSISGLGGVLGHGLTMLILRARLEDAVTMSLPASEWRWLIEYAVIMAMGMVLLLGSAGLTSLLHRMRDYPRRPVLPADAISVTRDS